MRQRQVNTKPKTMTTQEMTMWIHLFKKIQKQMTMKNEHKKKIMVTQLVL